ncbi:ArsB/NhaD family transporter [Micromonospora sp. KC213]|uniref:ArsB/NhaD family transporter n=1 Tax=Micromonospora sp. KC213 TaxID=2530378 RepID=UPI00105173AF|nr:ArsB/NhaD family transporter [Micromonospora sp. KC213]TDC33579.1 arsenic transporter [Micromonospora sp. KC213]
MPTLISVGLLASVMGFAVARPWRLPEAVAAVPAAVLAVVTGLVSWSAARSELAALAPTVGFLAAVLVLAHLADAHGVFAYAGALAARASRGSPRRLLALVFIIATIVTAGLSLDATVVLLTPVVAATAVAVGARSRPHLYACAHLANAASLLLPVSNLTNLLAFSASGLSFAGFAALMTGPWLAVLAVEYVIFRRVFALDLAAPAGPVPTPVENPSPPRFALVVLALTLAGFALAEPAGVHPAWIATAGALVLAAPRLARTPPARRWRTAAGLLMQTNPAFCAFVFALGIVVLAVRRHGLDTLVARVVPDRASLVGLLLAAGLAALLANLVSNLSATLILVPAVAASPGLVLAVLIGVNIGPNLTYVGSLANLLWRHILHVRGEPSAAGQFVRLGAVTVPACLLAGTLALWVALRIAGA